MYNRVKKISADKSYKRPAVTKQEQYTADEIAEKLAGYEEVDNIEDVPINTHIRYFSIDRETGEQKFRNGGFLSNKSNADKYINLSNGKISWSVQVDDAVFYRKLSHQEHMHQIQKKMYQIVAEKDYVIDKLKNYIKKKLNEEYDITTLLKQYKATIDQSKTTVEKQVVPIAPAIMLIKQPVSKPIKKSVSKTNKKPVKKTTKTSKKSAKK